MQNHFVISALGNNRPGLVHQLSKAVKDCGCNILDSRMAVLGGEFAVILLLAGTWDAIAKIESMIPRLEDSLDLTLISRRTEVREKVANLMPYAVEVVASDRPGIVHDIAQFFSSRDINIEELFTGSYAAAHTGTPMFSLHVTISVPTNTSIAALRGEFMDLCDQLNLDAVMEPVK
ncbi:MAG: glycine cleavage system protein R [Gammaproteobacteria bacterium]|jgi:glycine cleavage system transcriptional repressor|nr:glycine cleavage system protein R [Gammaproteobacteria bacterium]